MSGINIDDATLYYQYLINNNSTSTMLNAISGNSDNGDDISGLVSSGEVNSFSSILQNYLSGIGDNTSDAVSATESAKMAEKLSDVLEKAGQTEDTSSLTYQTVQELYDYFSNQVTETASKLGGTASAEDSKTSVAGKTAMETQNTSTIDKMNWAAMYGEEFDFSSVDSEIDAMFEESTLLS